MGIPIVIATNGYGRPITEAANGIGTPVEVATNGYGIPVVIVASGGLPVVGSGGGGPALSYTQAETGTIINAFTTPPTQARTTLIDNCVASLKSAGVWAKLDALYLEAAADSQAAKINWVAPGTYNATEVNGPTFTADRGFTGASTKYLDTGFNPTTAPSPKYVQNSATFFGWSLTSGQINAQMVGSSAAGVGGMYVTYSRNPTDQTVWRIQPSTSVNDVLANTDGSGLFSGSRTASNATAYYRNGAAHFTGSTTSGAPFNGTFFLLSGGGTYWLGQMAVAGIGSQLSAAEHTALYNALLIYLQGVGAVTDVTAPVVSSLSPLDNATGVSPTANLVATFNETVTLGATGNITIKRTSDNATIEAWDVATEGGSTAGKVEVVGGTALTMHLTTALADGIEYYVIWDAGVVKDAASNPVAAQVSTTAWSFTTTDYDSASDAIFAAFITPPTTARKTLIDACVLSLKSAGVWAKLDYLHLHAAADSQAALVNWKAPGTFNDTLINSPAFTVDRGFTGGATKTIDTGFDPAVAPTPNYTQNSAFFAGWSLTNTDSSSYFIYHHSTHSYLGQLNTGNMYPAINAVNYNPVANTDGSGFWLLSRQASAGYDIYRNGTLFSSPVRGSNALPAGNTLRYLNSWGGQIAAEAGGGGLNSTEQAALYNALRTYLTGVGVP